LVFEDLCHPYAIIMNHIRSFHNHLWSHSNMSFCESNQCAHWFEKMDS